MPPVASFGPEDPAAAIWAEIGDGGVTEGTVVRLLDLATGPGDAPGAWLPDMAGLAIEVWTECELSVLHAVQYVLLRLDAETRETRELLRRLDLALVWHLDHTQPDNATGRPWGINAVLLRGHPQAEAVDYAASMLHTVQAARSMGQPLDPVVAWILRDAVDGLSGDAAQRLSRTLR